MANIENENLCQINQLLEKCRDEKNDTVLRMSKQQFGQLIDILNRVKGAYWKSSEIRRLILCQSYFDKDNNGIQNLSFLSRLKIYGIIHLELHINKLKSLIQLSQWNIDTIKFLHLEMNELETLAGLQTAQWTCLKSIALQKNKLLELNGLKNGCFPCLKEIFLDSNNLINLKTLEQSMFLSLIHLSLSNNKIESIESLSNINLPNLSKLCLDGNNICHLQVFKRCHWPFLKILKIDSNKLNQVRDLQYLINKNGSMQFLNISFNQVADQISLFKFVSHRYLKSNCIKVIAQCTSIEQSLLKAVLTDLN